MILSLNVPDRLEWFPRDPESDIAVVLVQKKDNYSLRRSFLMKSQFFSDEFRKKDKKIILLNRKYNPEILDSILKTFYGYRYMVKEKDIYDAYQVCHYIQIADFLDQIRDQWKVSIDSLLGMFQLGELYEVNTFRGRCSAFLQNEPAHFKELFNLKQLEFTEYNVDQYSSPENVLQLQESAFKRLVKEHKHLRDRGLSQIDDEQIYKVLKQYTRIRGIDQRKDLLRKMLPEIIDPEPLTEKQYQLIYHANAIPEGQEMFNYLYSENVLLKKQLRDAREEVKLTQTELQAHREEIRNLQRKLTETLLKYNGQLEERRHVVTQITYQSENQSSKLQSSHLFIQNFTDTKDEHNNSFESNMGMRVVFDSTPQTVFRVIELNSIVELTDLSIFEKLNCNLHFRGTKDGFERLVLPEENYLVLIRTTDDQVIAYYDGRIINIVNQQQMAVPDVKIETNLSVLLKIGEYVTIYPGCQNHSDNYFRNASIEISQPKFQIDEIEIYTVKKSASM